MTDAEAPYRSRIRSLGVYLPERRLSSAELIERCKPGMRGLDFERLTGIRERRICAEHEDGLVLAIEAARDCLRRAAIAPESLDVVLSCSISRMRGELDYQLEPPLSLDVKYALGAYRAEHCDVTNACAGMLTGVAMLDGMIRAGLVRRGLVVSGEYISNIAMSAVQDLECPSDDQLASLTVGDAGAAVLIERAEPGAASIEACELRTVSEFSDLCFGRPRATGCGTAMHTQAQPLHEAAMREMLPLIRRALEHSNLTASDITWFVPHQTSTRSIRLGTKLVSRALAGGEPINVAAIVDACGNTASTSHFVAMHTLLEAGRIRRGDRLALLATASGIVVGCTIVKVDVLVDHYGYEHQGRSDLASCAE